MTFFLHFDRNPNYCFPIWFEKIRKKKQGLNGIKIQTQLNSFVFNKAVRSNDDEPNAQTHDMRNRAIGGIRACSNDAILRIDTFFFLFFFNMCAMRLYFIHATGIEINILLARFGSTHINAKAKVGLESNPNELICVYTRFNI